MTIEQLRSVLPLSSKLNDIEGNQRNLTSALAAESKTINDLGKLAPVIFAGDQSGLDDFWAEARKFTGQLLTDALASQKETLLNSIEQL